jgi:hypothetical protein
MERLGCSLDPLKPSSIRRGDMLWGAIFAGGGGWASSPIEAGGYCTAPPTCEFALLTLIRRAGATTARSSASRVELMICLMLITSPPSL